MRKIDKYITNIEQFVIWSGGYTDQECDSIVQLGELAEFQKGSIGLISGTTDFDIRNTDITWLQPTDESKWLFERMNELVSKINFDKFQLDLDRFDGFQYSKYKTTGHYDWHTDTNHEHKHGLFRKLSFSLLLTSPEEYEGGELLFNDKGNQDMAYSIKPKKGDLIAFYSHIPHKVSPVISGTRISLVTWALGNKLV